MFGDIFHRTKEEQNILITPKIMPKSKIVKHKNACKRMEIKPNANKRINTYAFWDSSNLQANEPNTQFEMS